MYVRHPWIYPLMMAFSAVAVLMIILSTVASRHLTGQNMVSLAFLLMWVIRITVTRNKQIREARDGVPPPAAT